MVVFIGTAAYAGPVTVACQGATSAYSNNGFSGACNGLPNIKNGDYGSGLPASNINLSLSITHDLVSGWYTMFEHADTFVYEGRPQCPNCANGLGSAATGSIDYSQGLNSGGDVRPGFLEIDGNSVGPLRSYNGSQTLTMGFPNGSLLGVPKDLATQSYCDAVQGYCGPSIYYFQYVYQYPIPVLLGTNMTLIAQSRLFDYVDPGYGLSTGYSDVQLRFRFTEANGALVTLIPTPKPSALNLFCLATLPTAIWLKRRSRLEETQATGPACQSSRITAAGREFVKSQVTTTMG